MTIDVKMWRIFYIFHYPNPSKRKKVSKHFFEIHYSESSVQVFKDWHLFLVVMMCVVVDVFILTIASSVNSARLKPIQTRDVRHGTTEVDVGKMSVTVVLAITYLSAGGRDHIESHGAFVCFPLETHLAWNVVWLQGNHSDNWSDSCPKHEEH